MAEANANIRVGVDTSDALVQLKALQRRIAELHSTMARGGAAAAAEAQNFQRNLVNVINNTGQFSASLTRISSTADSFTNALEKNKLSMGEYFRFAGASTKTFSKVFTTEFNTIEKVARERVKTLQTQYISLGRDASGALKGISVRPLKLDMKDLGTQVMMTAQKQQIFNRLIDQGSTNLLNFGKNTQWAGRQLMVGFTIPLTILGTTASKVFMEIEEQIIRFKRVYGEFSTSADEADKMAGKLRDLAVEFTKYGVAVKDTLAMAADAAAMGKMGNDLLAQVEQAAKLAVLGGVEQEKALETTIALTNTFGIATEDLTKKISFLNAVENQTVVSIEDLTTAIPKAGPVVRQLGGDVEDLAFFLTAMKEGGINASEGANALKSGLASLINPTQKASEMLAGFGINVKGIVEANSGDIKGTIIQFAQALDTLDPLNRARAIEEMFGKFQFARLSTLFQNIVTEGTQASRVLELTKSSAEELAILSERELKRVEESTGYKFKQALEEVKNNLAPIGEEFLKAITPIVKIAGRVLEWFNSLGDGAKQFAVIATAAVGVIAPTFLMMFGLIANGLANFIKGMSKVGGFLGILSGQSRLVGGSTEYMTSEQIQAAAVAASLDQTHQRLIQTFTAEAAAIQNLANAYLRAAPALRTAIPNVASATTAGKPPVSTNPFMPPKYADGILSVPGTGNKDTELALLTPGEAVIPAPLAKKFAPLISSMIADNVPGYSQGTQKGHIARNLNTSDPAVVERLVSGGMSRADVMDPGINILPDLTMDMPTWINQALKEGGGGVDPAIWIEAMGLDQMPGAFRETLQVAMGETGDQIDELADDIQQRIVNRAAAIAKQTGQVVSDEIVAEATDDVISDLSSGSALEQRASAGMAERRDSPSATRSSMGKAELDERVASGNAVITGSQVKTEDGTVIGRVRSTGALKGQVTKNVSPSAGGVSKPYQNRPGYELTEDQAAQQDVFEAQNKSLISEYSEQGEMLGRGIGDGVIGGTKDSLQIGSPSKRMYDLGANAGDSLASGFESSKAGTGKLAPPPAPMAPEAQPKNFLQRTKDKVLLAAAKPLARAAGNDLVDETTGETLYDAAADEKSLQYKLDRDREAARAEAELAASRDKSAEATEQLSRTTDQATESIERNTDAQEGMRSLPDGTKVSQSEYDSMMQKESNRQKRQQRAGRAAGILGTATMAVGMATQIQGPIGEFAQNLMPAVGGLAAVGPMLLALPAPIALLIAAVGSLVAIMYLYNKSMEAAYDQAYALAKAMGVGADAMQKFADFAGTVSANEVMNRRRDERLSQFTVQPGKQTFGGAFVLSEQGTEFVKTIKNSLSELGRDQTVSAIFSQLGNAVSQNILTAEQARSVAGNLGLALGDVGLGMEVNAKLTELLGPNGEDYLNDPIALRVKLVQMQGENLQTALDDYLETRNLLDPGANTAGGTQMMLSEEGRELISEERQRRYDEGGFWTDVATFFTPDDVVRRQILQSELGGLGASIANSLSQQQSVIDAIRLDSEKKIADAIAEGADYSTIQDLREEEATAINDAIAEIKASAQETVDVLESLSVGDQGEQRKQLRQRLLEQELPEGVSKGQVGTAFDDLFETGDFTKNFILAAAFESGDFTFEEFKYISDLPEDRKKIYYDISTSLGSGEASQIAQISNIIKDEDVKAEFELSFEGLEGSDLTAAISQAETLFRLGEMFRGDLSIPVSFALNNETQMTEFMANIDEFSVMAQEGGFDANIELFTQIFGAEELAAAQAGILANQAEFDALPDEMQLNYGMYYTLFADMAVSDPAILDMMEQATGLEGQAAIAAYVMDYLPSLSADSSLAPSEPTTTSGGDGGPDASWLDPIVRQLRDFKTLQQEITTGFDDSLAAIVEFSKTGVSGFRGLSNQLRAIGVSEPLIEKILGMSPEEWNEQKDQIFNFDAAGNITGLTAAGQAIQDALATANIASFVAEQDNVTVSVSNQIVALDKLTAAGASYEAAYRAVANTALAAAVATAKSSADIQAAAEAAMAAQAMMDKFEKINEEEMRKKRIADAIKEQNKEFSNQAKILNYINKNRSKLSEEQMEAILSNKDLQSLILEPSIAPSALKTALDNANKKAQLELDIKKLTLSGSEEIFQTGFSNAMEAFNAEEQKIELEFDAKMSKDQSILDQAQEEIAKLEFQLDDFEAGLTEIENQEDKINEAYEKRFEALDKIAEANAEISRQQQSQLDIADALSRGDIAAAARAVQEARAAESQAAMDAERKRLEQSQQAEVSALRSGGGLSREELDQRVKDIQDQIFRIEEDRLEPAQEAIRLAELQKQKDIEGLEVLGKTREEWDKIANRIDLAKISNYKFVDSMKEALNIVEDLIAKYGLGPEPKTKSAPASSGGGGGGGGGGSSRSSSSPTPPPSKRGDDGNKGPDPAPTPTQVSRPTTTNKQLASQVITKQATAASAAKQIADSIRAVTSRGIPASKSTYVQYAQAAQKAAEQGRTAARARAKTASSGGLMKYAMGGFVRKAMSGPPQRYAMGGMVSNYLSTMANGGMFMGSDSIPALLTPGEFVIRRPMVQGLGPKNLEKLNRGEKIGGDVYNYNLNVNVRSDSDPNQIARTVMSSIRQIENKKIRGNRF